MNFNKNKKLIKINRIHLYMYSIFENTNNIKKNSKMDAVKFAPFLIWNMHDDAYFENVNNIMKQDNTYIDEMKEAFFSEKNIDFLQKSIIVEMYKRKNIKLRPQKYETIIQLMNSIWNKHSNNLPFNYTEQIQDLNNKLIEYSCNSLTDEITAYYNFIRDQDIGNNRYLEPPISTNIRRQ